MLGVTSVALMGLAVYLGLRASQWERIERFLYLATVLLAAVGGALLVASTQAEHITLLGSLVGYLLASSGFGFREREFSSLAKERAWRRFGDLMAKNKWFNLTLGLALIAFSLWKLFVLSQ